jgi:hypothetical protein
MVDILPEIAGVDFDAAWRRRVVEIVDAETGVKAAFIAAADLIAAKLASARPQDLADVEAIRTAQTEMPPGSKPGRRPTWRKRPPNL